jgi:hypothetical protein
MVPVSQLDGGHVAYTLFKKGAHWIARGFLVGTIVFIVSYQEFSWILMVVLVLVIGPYHPPTRDDNVRLGWSRTALGCASLLIPIFCLPPFGIYTNH